MRCVGYRQVWEYLEGEYDAQEMRNRGVYATRQLAKRQLTWLRGMRPETVDCLDEGVSTRVKNWVDRALGSIGSEAGLAVLVCVFHPYVRLRLWQSSDAAPHPASDHCWREYLPSVFRVML